MKNNTQPALKERIEKALEEFTKGRASMHVPPLDTDVDVVLAESSDRLSELEARLATLAAENAGLKSANHIALKILNDDETMVTSLWASSVQEVEVKTPATDAFLAEVRASGVEMFAAWNDKHINPGVEHKESLTAVSHAARGLAEQIRKGVRS
ncbi:hypothetical protein PE051_05820 [Enterobacter asburiae]|uniref:hypothetical protein n=1 Tax=Enterobacter asburiae TaxID=61645 RepID=UPI0031BAF97A